MKDKKPPVSFEYQQITPKEAIKELKKLAPEMSAETVAGLLLEVTEVAFIASQAMNLEMAIEFQTVMAKSLESGISFQEFYKKLSETQGAIEKKIATRVYRTNLTSALAQGKKVVAEEFKSTHPNLKYVTQRDGAVRESHRKLHGLIAPIDHPLWRKFTPALGFNCRCTLISTREKSNYETYGLGYTKEELGDFNSYDPLKNAQEYEKEFAQENNAQALFLNKQQKITKFIEGD
jgi:SPP1 gp7 family putative phage head morphogenesis protein